MPSAKWLRKNDASFPADLRKSEPARQHVGNWLRYYCDGWTVVVPKLRVRKTEEERAKFSDKGDIILRKKIKKFVPKRPERAIVEVKHRDERFTCAADYKYPTFIVGRVDLYHRKDPEPFAYFFCNKSLTVVGIMIVASTKSSWKIEKLPIKGRKQRVYTCPTELLMYRSLIIPKERENDETQ